MTGLAGSGLVLQNVGGDNLSVSANGSFTFSTAQRGGATYAVTVLVQPTAPSQVCSVTNGTGTVGAGNVTGVRVSCSTSSFTVGGTVAGLSGHGLVLRNNGGDDLAISANGSFAFAAPVASGGSYAVTVWTQPSAPTQTCTVTNGSGAVGDGNVASIAIACVTNSYTVGGTVIGLQGTGLVLATPGRASITVPSGATAFVFAAMPSGTTYDVSVASQPSGPAQTCTVGAGTGTVAAADVTSVVVNCSANHYLVGGTVSGLSGTGLVVATQGQPDLAIPPNATSFVFATAAPSGSSYEVTVKAQPTSPSQTCAVTRGIGTVGSANVTSIAVACVTNAYALGGTVSGLSGTGLVLATPGQPDLAVPSTATSFAFATAAPSGSAYAVTVKAQPTSPSQACTVTNGTGVMGNGDVTSIAVTCSTSTFTVGGTVAGLVGSGLVLSTPGQADLAVPVGASTFTFGAAAPSGSAYAVTVKTQPTSPSQTCTVTNGGGTVGDGNVTGVAVDCVTNAYKVGGAVTNLKGTLVLQDSGAEEVTVQAGAASYVFATPVPSGQSYAIAVRTQPSSPAQTCTLANATGTVGSADVTTVNVTCASTVIQEWATPAAWGGDAHGVWPDASPSMVQHLIFDATGPLETKLAGGTWIAPAGTPAITPTQAIASPEISRYGAGPFGSAGAPLHYQWSGDSSALNLPGDILVCALVKPDWDPLMVPDTERILIAKGKQEESGWVLMQMHGAFCFHYQSAAGGSGWVMNDTATYFTNEGIPDHGPLNSSYVVVCAGRDAASGRLAIAVNSYEPSVKYLAISPAASLFPSARPVSVGGYDDASPTFVFKGKIYETAVWNEPATPANVQAKMAPVLGMTLPDGSLANFVRNREAPFVGLDGLYHTGWRHAPRIYPQGILFGLEGTNRVAYPEEFDRWTKPVDSVQSNVLLPPNDSDIPSADHVTLPPGAGLSLVLGTFTSPNAVQGQIWIRPDSTGTLRVRSDEPGTPPVPRGQQDVDLATLAPGQWTRVPITGLSTGGASVAGTVYLENPGTDPIGFYAWGMYLTQIARGQDVGFDPGFTIYDTLKESDGMEALVLPPIAESTADGGFCLVADAAPFEGMAWNAPFPLKRVAVSWNGTAAGVGAQLYADATNVCLRVTDGATGKDTCGSPSVAWLPGSMHTMKACITPAGQMSVYGDGTLLQSAFQAVAVPDLQGGSIHVGSGDAGSWQGYVSRARACRNTGADCN